MGSKVLAGILAVALMVGSLAPVGAQQRRERLQFLSDAETEHIIRRFAQPIFEAAAIDGDAVSIALVNDSRVNAFVAGGMNLFINTGLLLETDDPGQLIGVLAHEIGHIAGGHLVRARDAMEGASAQAVLAAILGAAAMAAGGGEAGAALMLGGQQMATANFLAFTRSQESSADQAALSYLDQAGLSSRGMLDFLEELSDQEGLPANRQAEFMRTHPLTRDRIEAVRHHVEHSRLAGTPMPAEFVEMHRRMIAKLRGYVNPPAALQRYKADDASVAARYGRAMALYRRGEIAQALTLVDGLIAQEPKNPFFYELKGQILMENGRLADSLAPYRKAVELEPGSPLLRSALAQALIENNNPRLLDEAIRHLEEALRRERRSPASWRLMATAYGRKGNQGMVSYALAEEALAQGDRVTARTQAERAEALLPAGSPGWLRAQDIRIATAGKPGAQ